MTRLCSMLLTGGLAIAAQAATFTGVITDTMCAAQTRDDEEPVRRGSVRMCGKGQHGYALFDGTTVLKLSDQKTPAKYAAQRVKVTGTLDGKTHMIKVTLIEPEGDSK